MINLNNMKLTRDWNIAYVVMLNDTTMAYEDPIRTDGRTTIYAKGNTLGF